MREDWWNRVTNSNCHFSNTLKTAKNWWNIANPVIKIYVRCRHFDIWDSWDLQVNWKMPSPPYTGWHPPDTLKYIHIIGISECCPWDSQNRHDLAISFVPNSHLTTLDHTKDPHLDGEELWHHHPRWYNKHKQHRQAGVHYWWQCYNDWLECQLERRDTRWVSTTCFDIPGSFVKFFVARHNGWQCSEYRRSSHRPSCSFFSKIRGQKRGQGQNHKILYGQVGYPCKEGLKRWL